MRGEEEGEPDAGQEEPEEPEHESDASDTEDSSDASEDDVDKDLVRAAAEEPPASPVKEEESSGIRIPMLVDQAPPVSPAPAATAAPPPTSPLTAPPTSPTKPTKKPKSHHVPVPPPVIAPPPMQTIRLQITLGGPNDYEIDMRKQAKTNGVEWGTLMVEKKYADDSSDDESGKDADGDIKMEDGKDAKPKKKKTKRKTKAATEYYDVNDPFIDDSELAIDQRTYIAQTKQKGFYVSSGEVQVVRDKPAKKPAASAAKGKKKAPALSLNLSKPASKAVAKSAPSSAAPSAKLGGLGTKESPIPLEDDDDDAPSGSKGKADESEVGKKRKRTVSSGGDAKKRKTVDVESFHPELQSRIARIKVAVAEQSWENKSKFPLNLKPMLADLAMTAVKLDEYDDSFFALMPDVFPYNRFTMTKLIKRTIFQEHTELLNQQQTEQLAQLKALADEGFPKAQEEWEKNVANYEEKQKAKAGSENPEGGGGSEDADAASKEGDAKPTPAAHGPPPKRYRMTEAMKAIVWRLVLLSNELCRLENEKNQLEGSVLLVSEQGLRKTLYQRIVNAFPQGWMASGQISRDVSAMKKKFEKEAAEE
ncbi:hypothetical protein MKEN_00586100 [Mycena kentingensis (nom. inval.)]|nr:hypothetical protein MKEN_00586100 [Mycena kentingensis (nom. inval.)]